MGWWNSKDEPEVIVGDEPLDIASELLHRIASCYVDSELGRKPTPTELERTLELALSTSIAEIVQGGESLDLSRLTLKTKRRPKRHKVLVGDVFAVPLDDGRFAFGRVMVDVPKRGYVVEYFRGSSATATWRSDIAGSGRLGMPRAISGRALEERLWPTVARRREYEPSDEDKTLEFAGGMPPHMWVQDIYFEVIRERIDVEEGKSLPRLETPAPEYEAKNILRALAELESSEQK